MELRKFLVTKQFDNSPEIFLKLQKITETIVFFEPREIESLHHKLCLATGMEVSIETVLSVCKSIVEYWEKADRGVVATFDEQDQTLSFAVKGTFDILK